MNNSLLQLARIGLRACDMTERVHAIIQVGIRVYVGRIFFLFGLAKLNDWPATVALFANGYKLPLLSPEVWAGLTTAGELLLPVLLVLGLGGRLAAIGLFIINVVAANVDPTMSAAAVQQHAVWGCLLAFLAIWGPGNYSADRFIAARVRRLTSIPAPTAPHNLRRAT
jgi:putative oxidoreductase